MDGTAYKIAYHLRRFAAEDAGTPAEVREPLARAVSAILKAAPQLEDPDSAASASCFSGLATIFDIDSIIGFSGAWERWENAEGFARGEATPTALDQELFKGRHPGAARYFGGISELARRSTPKVVSWAERIGFRAPRLLDVGAGAGDYARAFVKAGVADEVVCLDFPFVVESIAKREAPGTTWLSRDLTALRCPEGFEPVDAMWISNVLHHYSMADCVDLVRGLRPFGRERARILVHEYLVDTGPPQGLAASILGLHFALTTGGGRCFTCSELDDVFARSGYGPRLRQPVTAISSVTLYERAERD